MKSAKNSRFRGIGLKALGYDEYLRGDEHKGVGPPKCSLKIQPTVDFKGKNISDRYDTQEIVLKGELERLKENLKRLEGIPLKEREELLKDLAHILNRSRQ